MFYIDNFSQKNSFDELTQPLVDAVAKFSGRILKILGGEEKVSQEREKIENVSGLFFETPELARGDENEAPSAHPVPQKLEKEEEGFNFKTEIEKVKMGFPIEEQDGELASRFCKIINPDKIPDGHCASCAFNTHVHLAGGKLEEGRDPSKNFKEFGDWFYLKVYTRFEDITIESEQNETYGSFKERVAQKVKEHTEIGEAILISICDGTHWYNAFRDGNRVWFIDSQTGQGFNLYDGKSVQPEDIIPEPQLINIIKITQNDIEEYQRSFPPSSA
jgi:glutamine deamidase